MPKIIRPVLDFEINSDSINEGFTQSEMQTQDNCGEKWYLGYNLMLSLRGKHSWALAYGGWLHEAWEEFYSTKGKRWHIDPKIRDKHFLSAEQLSTFEYWVGLANIQMQIYASHYKSDFKFYDIISTEEIIEFEWQGVILKAMVDLYVLSKQYKGWYMMDHKTTGKIDKKIVTGWDFRLQFMFYCWLCYKTKKKTPPSGYFINAMKKPQLKQGEHEPNRVFLQRVQTDMQLEPEKYFYRERLILKRGDLEHFEQKVLQPKIDRIKILRDPNVSNQIKIAMFRNMNTDYCMHYQQPCEFLNACKRGLEIEKEFFRRRDIKHMELIEPE